MKPRLTIKLRRKASPSEGFATSNEDYVPTQRETMESKRLRWRDDETAFILNHADVCLANKQMYRDTVVEAFSKCADREVTIKSICSKLDTSLAKYHNSLMLDESTSVCASFFRQGTRFLDIASLPFGVFQELKSQRIALGLAELSAVHPSEGSAAQHQTAERDPGHSTTRTASSLEPAAGSRQNSQKLSQQYVISDSDLSSEDERDTSDDTYGSQPARKKQKLSISARSQGGKGQRPGKTPQGIGGASAQQGRAESEHPDEDAAGDMQSTQRNIPKSNKSKVVDVSSPTPSPELNPLATVEEAPVLIPGLLSSHDDQKSPLEADQTTLRESQDTIVVQSRHGNSLQSKTKDHGTAPRAAIVPKQMLQLAPKSRAIESTPGTPRSSVGDNIALDMVKDLAQLVGILMKEQARSNPGWTQEIEDRLKCIRRTVEREPGQLLEKTLQDLRSADAANKDLRAVVNDLIGRREFHKDNDFPRCPDARDLAKSWKALREHVRDAFGDSFFPEFLPRGVSMGYVAARIDDLVRVPRTQKLGTTRTFLEDLAAHLHSPHLVRALLGAMLCRWLFRAPEPMCQNVYSQKEIKLYESLLQNGRASELQHLDKLGLKLLFADEKFQENDLRPRARGLLVSVGNALKKAWPNAPGFGGLNDPSEWSENAVKLKQTLMISPKDYRIHYCVPDSPFESSWMQAEDAEGLPLTDAEAKDKRVSACLFPALAELEPNRLGDKPVLAEVLASDKVFFPTSVEKQNFDPKKIIAKAVVLVG